MRQESQSILTRTALDEVSAMRSAAADADAGNRIVRMSVDKFRGIAALLEELATSTRVVDPDGFDAPVDGMRFWVPLPHYRAIAEEVEILRARIGAAD